MILAMTSRYRSTGIYYISREFKDIFEELGITLFPVATVREHEKIAEICQGLVLTGSSINVNPRHYGETPIEQPAEKCEEMDELDFTLIRAFRRVHKPVLAICRGCQALNVCFGGSLRQKVPDHNLDPAARHPVQIEDGSFLQQCYGKREIQVNSLHCQAVNRPGRGFRPAAVSPDGVIEAIEQDNMLGVQWHPEMMMDIHFFKTFVKRFL